MSCNLSLSYSFVIGTDFLRTFTHAVSSASLAPNPQWHGKEGRKIAQELRHLWRRMNLLHECSRSVVLQTLGWYQS